jgi:iron complex outermembrane receptor protein
MSIRNFARAAVPAAACLACSPSLWAADTVLAAAEAASSPSAAATTLDTVEVKAVRQPYRNISATGATKNDALIKDLPMSVRVITADLLSDAGVTDLSGALDLSSGISRQNNFGGLWNSYSMRGFTGDPNFGSDYMVNGFNSSRGYNGLRDGANTNTVEVLKGPSSALYGRGEPGGTVNITTKKPLFQPAQTIEVSAGSFNTWRTAVDLTGPVGESFAYRLNAAFEDGDSFRDTVHSQHYLVSPSFVWLLSDRTTLSYEVEAVQQKAPFDRGVLAVNNQLGVVPVSRFLGEPGDGDMTIRSLGHQIFLQHDFNDDWSLQTGLSYRKSSLTGYSTEASALQADLRTLWRQRRFRDYNATDVSGRFEVLGKVATGPVKHSLLFGVDAYSFDDDRYQMRGRPSAAVPYSIDIYDPVYGASVAPTLVPITNTQERQRARAAYAQDQLEFSEQWKALVGVRYDTYEQTVTNLLATPAVVTEQSPNATSPRVGLVYQPTKTLSLYATASKGFRPNSGASKAGGAFPPETSRSYEVGAKLDSADGKLTGTLAVYQIRKKNVLTTDPTDINYSIAVGEVESKGVELDVSGEIVANLRLSAAYAYTDSHVTSSTAAAAATGLAQGRRFPNVPRNTANVFATYYIPLPNGQRASIGGGVNYVGERLGSVDLNDAFTLPAYTVFKLVSSYTVNKHLRLSLDVDNLFNKAHYTNSYSSLWVYPGTERKFTGTAQYKF